MRRTKSGCYRACNLTSRANRVLQLGDRNPPRVGTRPPWRRAKVDPGLTVPTARGRLRRPMSEPAFVSESDLAGTVAKLWLTAGRPPRNTNLMG
jgi:hypothetical protein